MAAKRITDSEFRKLFLGECQKVLVAEWYDKHEKHLDGPNDLDDVRNFFSFETLAMTEDGKPRYPDLFCKKSLLKAMDNFGRSRKLNPGNEMKLPGAEIPKGQWRLFRESVLEYGRVLACRKHLKDGINPATLVGNKYLSSINAITERVSYNLGSYEFVVKVAMVDVLDDKRKTFRSRYDLSDFHRKGVQGDADGAGRGDRPRKPSARRGMRDDEGEQRLAPQVGPRGLSRAKADRMRSLIMTWDTFNNLPEASRRALCGLSLFQRWFPWPVGEGLPKFLATITKDPADVVAGELEKLKTDGLVIERRERGSIRPADRRHAYIRARDQLGLDSLADLHGKAVTFCLESAGEALYVGDTLPSAWVDRVIQAFRQAILSGDPDRLLEAHGPIWAAAYESVNNAGKGVLCTRICLNMIDAARKAGRSDLLSSWQHALAILAHEGLGDYSLTKKTCVDGLTTAKKIGDNLVQGHLCHRLGSTSAELGEYAEARDSYEKGLPLKREGGGSSDDIDFTQCKLLELDMLEGRLTKDSLEFIENCCRFARERDLKLRFGMLSPQRIRALRMLGLYDKAVGAGEEAYEVVDRNRFQLCLPAILRESGLTALARALPAEARLYFNKSLRQAARLGRTLDMSLARTGLGLVSQFRGNDGAATRHYDAATRLAFLGDVLLPALYRPLVMKGVLLSGQDAGAAAAVLSDAISRCDMLLAKIPQLMDVLACKALALLARGQINDACDTYYRTAVRDRPYVGLVDEALRDLDLLVAAVGDGTPVSEGARSIQDELRAFVARK